MAALRAATVKVVLTSIAVARSLERSATLEGTASQANLDESRLCGKKIVSIARPWFAWFVLNCKVELLCMLESYLFYNFDE